MALLDSGLAAVFGAAFGAVYLPGVVHVPAEPVFDDGGSIVPGDAPASHPCRVQVDAVTERMRQAEGYTDKDIRLLILTAGLGVTVTTDCEVEVSAGAHAGRWMLASADLDAAGAYWDCRGRRA